MPDDASMSQYRDSKWVPGTPFLSLSLSLSARKLILSLSRSTLFDSYSFSFSGEPIPGTIEWRNEMCQLHTPDRFFKRMVHGDNPLLSYMRRTHSLNDLMSVEIPQQFVR
jgi:hypothetical protein